MSVPAEKMTPAATPAVAQAPAPAPAPAPSNDFDIGDVEKLLKFDPFEDEAPAATTSEPPKEPKAEVAAPAAAPVAGTEGNPAGTPAAPAATQADPEKDLMRKQLAELQATVATLRQTTQQPQQQQSPQGAPSDGIPSYEYTIPPQLMQLIDSENPAERQQGIGALIQGVSRTIHKTVLGQMQQLIQTVPQYIEQHSQQQAQSKAIFDDFYGTHKELNRPELRGLVVSVAQQVFQEVGPQAWSPQVRDVIAQRVFSIIGRPGSAPAAAPVPTAGFAPGGPAARPPVASNPADEIKDTIMGGWNNF